MRQPYIKITRSIQNNEQVTMEEHEFLQLCEEKITTGDNTFAIKDVHDISYRSFSSSHGFLYLHTHQGVFPYRITESPTQFIEKYKDIKRKRKDL